MQKKMETWDAIHIDLPVKLEKSNLAFSIDRLDVEGDLPAAMFHMELITKDTRATNAKGQIVAIFHTNAGHALLNDESYNIERNVSTGNPYKGLLANLREQGIQLEMCGATAATHSWVNADFLPEVKVNTDAMSRVTQLSQQGFVIIAE